ncbi:30S ribosomal protein S8 [Candidatus Peribacteria bacterium RIFCSPHIGHO2_02_FULL_53_20]|nr:MAG: 30S ribosomal protein S8 [Candidatus Peribacteria bacterium RIFCSPHIGHO2_02_FULL_53_20]OGJ67083.1 MAG: 30S ribosomal protein S8 [Candidatus Peribacteria bacterium RIFCSPLOWO2_01_FULL_53_10]OGJ70625.1 MAG: 30S ribosomal protein S8 [Candidatus Peribacteria bacterium RIFCSPLOWO2_12_FULL_53_10]
MSPVNDPIGDLLTRIRNAQAARREGCTAPYSRIKHELLTVLKQDGWIAGVAVEGEIPEKQLIVTFAPERLKLTIKRVSTPGRRVYSGSGDMKPVIHGFGVAILTTSKGLMTDKEAKKQKVGGEVLCTIS